MAAAKKTPAEAPATALMGAALLAAIASNEVTRITQEQAGSLDSTHFEVNTADVVDGAAMVRLTDAGAAAAKAAAGDTGDAGKASFEIDDNVPMPDAKRAGPREAVYPFHLLTKVGQSFHVPKTAENPDPGTRLSSSVSGARVRYSPLVKDAEGKVVMETVQRDVFQKDAEGNYVKGADGKRIKTGTEPVQREKRGEPTRDFKVVSVGKDDPRGEGARCFLTKFTA